MKKRLFCLLLCLLMVLPAVLMTGCADDEEITAAIEGTSIKALTLTLYSITNENTTEEAIAAVQDAINEITEREFNTHIILRLFPEKEYSKLIMEKISAIEEQLRKEEAEEAARKVAQKAAKAAGVTTPAATTEESTTDETEETQLNEYGLPVTVYPEEDGDQLDIFLIDSLEMYNECYEAGVLSALDEELSVNSKAIRKYVSPALLDYIRKEGATYAIPNNHIVGEYQFLLLNRELIDKYAFDPDSITTVGSADFKDYINIVSAKEKDYVPMLNRYELPLFYPTADCAPVLGSYVSDTSTMNLYAPKNVLGIRQFKNLNAMMLGYEQDGILKTGELEEGGKYASAIVKGDYSLKEKYEDDYYVVTLTKPVYTNEEVFGSMYAVGTYTKSVSRCMEVITYLTTNEQLRNTFQYGVEGTHYTRDEDGLVHVISNDYSMDSRYTGNVFKLWPSDQMSDSMRTLAANDWEIGKLHNLNYGVGPYLGFQLSMVDKEVKQSSSSSDEEETGEVVEYMGIQEIMDGLAELNAYVEKKLADFKPYTDEDGNFVDAEAFIQLLADEIDSNEYFIQATDKENINSPAGQYTNWYTELYGGGE